MQEFVGIVAFSGFMALLVGLLIGYVLLSIYRERKQQRKAGAQVTARPPDE